MAVVVILVALFFCAIGATAAYVAYRSRQARIHAVAAVAASIGFAFTQDDVDGVVSMPFVLFSKGKKQGVELVISGVHNELPMRMFDFWYYDETSDSNGGTSRTYHRYTCAIATIPAACPRLQIGHENFLTRLGDHLGLKDVEFEYDDFNRQFRVKCNDQKFAFSLLDGKMMQWLMRTDEFSTVEVDGPWVMLAVPRRDPSRWLELGSWLDQFHRQVPPVVYSTYPTQ